MSFTVFAQRFLQHIEVDFTFGEGFGEDGFEFIDIVSHNVV